MTCVYKVLLVCALMEWSGGDGVSVSNGISFHKQFEFHFKPLPMKPITFMKQAWSPLGSFLKKFTIQKRSLDDMMGTTPTKAAAPVFEDVQDEPIGTEPLLIIPKAPVIAYNMPIAPSFLTPLPQPMPIIVHDYPSSPLNPLIVPPVSSNLVEINSDASAKELYTDITKVKSVKEFMDSSKELRSEPPELLAIPADIPIPVSTIPSTENIVPVSGTPIVPGSPAPIVEITPNPVVSPPPLSPPISPQSPELVQTEAPEPTPVLVEEVIEEKPPSASPPVEENVPTGIIPKDNPLLRGTKIALHFGKVFMSFMGKFFDNARASIDMITIP